MLLSGFYYIADTYDDQEEIILHIVNNVNTDPENSTKIILAISPNSMIFRYKDILYDAETIHDVSVLWLTPSSSPEPNHIYIFIHEQLDDMAKKFMEENDCVLALFS